MFRSSPNKYVQTEIYCTTVHRANFTYIYFDVSDADNEAVEIKKQRMVLTEHSYEENDDVEIILIGSISTYISILKCTEHNFKFPLKSIYFVWFCDCEPTIS